MIYNQDSSAPSALIYDNFSSTDAMKCSEDYQQVTCVGTWMQTEEAAVLVIEKNPVSPKASIKRSEQYESATAKLDCKLSKVKAKN